MVGKKMLFILGALLATAVIIFAVVVKRNQERQAEKQINFPAYPSPAGTPAREPEIGMSYDKFKNICGDPTRTKYSRYASGDRTILFYELNDRNRKSGCLGYYVFDDGRLISIHSE